MNYMQYKLFGVKVQTRKYLKELKERETEYKADIENYRKEGHSWKEIFEMLKLRISVDPVVAECNLIS